MSIIHDMEAVEERIKEKMDMQQISIQFMRTLRYISSSKYLLTASAIIFGGYLNPVWERKGFVSMNGTKYHETMSSSFVATAQCIQN